MLKATRPDQARHYSSPSRAQAKRATRERIIDALVRVVLDEGVHAFSVASVAARAGVSHRTVYRHFASREELLEGLAEAVDSTGRTEGPEASRDALGGITPDLQKASAHVGLVMHGLETLRDRATAEFIIGVALRHLTRGKRERWARVQSDMRERFPALSPDEQLAGAAAVRALLSSNTWFHLCVQLGIPTAPVVEGVSRAVELVMEDLGQRNAARSRQKKRHGGR